MDHTTSPSKTEIYEGATYKVETEPVETEAPETLPQIIIPVEVPAYPVYVVPKPYTAEELFCLSAVIYNEAGSDMCSDEHRKLVGYVVLNRVNDPRFPNTIRGVLEQPGQYAGMENGVVFPERFSEPGEAHAVERAYRIAEELLENRDDIPIPANVVFQSQFILGTGIYTQIGNTYFCYAEEVN